MTDVAFKPLYIVGLGTSAGGLEALERFFKAMPASDQFAFLVVQHLSPDYKSHMVELLSKHSLMPVHQAQDGMKVQPGGVYLLPPRKNMTIFKGALYLMDYDRSQGLNLPIDILFESLAKDQGNKAIACVLSGTGSDGTRGIRAIKDQGGMVLVQDDSAKFDGMPRSAIATQLVDYVSPPEKIPEILLRYAASPHNLPTHQLQLDRIGFDQDMIGKVLAILRDSNGMDFTGYKPNTLIRRIERRMSLYEIQSLDEYVDFLQRSSSERKVLFKEFLISVTSFFRDREAFDYIQSDVIPALLNDKDRKQQIRVWAPGCATGEEAYSLAILFQEYMERTGQIADIKIFATDIDRDALDRAGRGVYPESVVADMPQVLLENYFIKNGDHYEVLRQIRSMVVFAYQSIITDPPFSRIDLVVCRNLLIYLQPEVQKRIISIFQFALKPGGFLFLGSSESLGDRAAEFSVEHSKWKIYRFRGSYNPLKHAHLVQPESQADQPPREIRSLPKPVGDWRSSDPVLRSLIENILPPCVVVDENMAMVHGFGEIDRYLGAPKGYQVNLNILKLVREELSIPLSTALHRTFKENEEVCYKNIDVNTGGQLVRIDLGTRIFWQHGSQQKLALITFTPTLDQSDPPQQEHFKLSESVNQRISNLEQELQYTRENLQATIEELETANEELQATNEELMAANEELQSTNEELESVNEELLTVNNEYQMKIKEMGALNDDMNNLLKSIDVGTIFLDAELNVRRFTPSAQSSISLLEQDIGRPIQHFAHNLLHFNLTGAILQVIDSLVPSEFKVENSNGQWYLLRITPYRTHTNIINGVVMTLVDITELEKTSRMAETNAQFAQTILNSLTAHIAVLDEDGIIMQVNDAWRQFAAMNGGNPDETDIGSNYLDVCQTATGLGAENALQSAEGLRALMRGEIDSFDLEYPCHAPDEQRWYLLRAVPLYGDRAQLVVSHINITDRKLAENAARINQERFRLALQTTTSALFEHDRELRYTWLHNPGLPYPPPQALGQTDADLLGAAAAGPLLQLKMRVLQSRQGLESVIRLDEQPYNVLLEPILDDEEQITGIMGMITQPDV